MLHFDGPMVAGGSGYDRQEILTHAASRHLPTGTGPLDDAVGGIQPGEVWTISGTAGIGVSRIVERFAITAAHVGTVLLANGHLGSRAIAGRLAEIRPPTVGNLRIASWLPLPWLGDERWDGACETADLVVLDTWDEMWRPTHWGRSIEERIADARWLRELARRHGTALLLTARLAAPGAVSGDAHIAQDSRGRHAEVFDDVADVSLEVTEAPIRGQAVVHARRRGGAVWSGPVNIFR